MISREFAERFSKHWIDSWNSHDLEAVLSHYSDDFEMSSPYTIQIAGESSGTLKGKAAVGRQRGRRSESRRMKYRLSWTVPAP